MNQFKFYLNILLLTLCCILSTTMVGQSEVGKNCAELTVYADSLDKLLLARQPVKAIQMADSVLMKNKNSRCSATIRINVAKGRAYQFRHEFETALEIYHNTLKVATNNNLKKEEVDIKLSLAVIYEANSRPKLCKQYLAEAKQTIDQYQVNSQLSRYYIRAASYERLYADKRLAQKYALLGIQLGEQYGVVRSVADGNLLLGILTEDFAKSIAYSQRSADLFFELGNFIMGTYLELNMARRFLMQEDFVAVEKIITKVKALSENYASNDRIYFDVRKSIARREADLSEKIGDKDRQIAALQAYNNYSELSTDLDTQDKINQLILDNSLSEEKEKVAVAKRRSQLLLVVLLILSVIVITLARLYLSNRKKSDKIAEQTLTITQQYKELTELYDYQSTLLNEVHHRIKNNLQLIISLLTLQKAKLGNVINSNVLEMLCYRINSIALIHEQLYHSKEFDTVNVARYAEDILANYRTLATEQKVKITYEIENLKLNLETVTPLGLIWSELISNSIKYNQNSTNLIIHFSLSKQADRYTMHYYDNGVGYPDGEFRATPSGMGFMIIQSLSRQLFAETNMHNSSGAHFTMKFTEKTLSTL